MLKQAFERGEELQEEVVPLSNTFSNRLDDLIDSFDEEDIISRRQNRNATSPQLSATRRDRVAGHSKPEERMEGAKGNTSDVNFFYQRIIKCN